MIWGWQWGVEVVGAPGLFYVYYGPGPMKAGEAVVYGLNWHPQECTFRVNLHFGQI